MPGQITGTIKSYDTGSRVSSKCEAPYCLVPYFIVVCASCHASREMEHHCIFLKTILILLSSTVSHAVGKSTIIFLKKRKRTKVILSYTYKKF